MGLFRRVWPKHQLADKVAFSFTHIGLVGIFLFNFMVVLPVYHAPWSPMYSLHVASALFLMVQVFTNMYRMLLSNATVTDPSLMLPSSLHSGWFYCPTCQVNAPPRSHHCPVCEVCVLKRDHHCVFTGNCVGHKNHRFFMMFCIYLWIGCTYTCMFNYAYYTHVFGQVEPMLMFKMVFPMMAYLLSYVTAWELFVLVVCGVNCMAMMLFTTLVGFQTLFISMGQTQFEMKKTVKDYNHGLAANWRLVLGDRWYLALLSAYFESRLPHDGTNFKKPSDEPIISAKDL